MFYLDKSLFSEKMKNPHYKHKNKYLHTRERRSLSSKIGRFLANLGYDMLFKMTKSLKIF